MPQQAGQVAFSVCLVLLRYSTVADLQTRVSGYSPVLTFKPLGDLVKVLKGPQKIFSLISHINLNIDTKENDSQGPPSC